MNKKIFLTGASLGSALILCAATTASRKPDLAKVDFTAETSSVSDPSNIDLYLHEEIVNSFLRVKSKFGRGRVMEMHYNNEHLATHNGTTSEPRNWRDPSYRYQLTQWGLLGGVSEKSRTVYYLSTESPQYKKQVAEHKSVKADPELNSRDADAFEQFATDQLVKGEKLVKWERPEFVRFVGGIYAAKSCLSCHAEAKEGDVLGAFTYEYRKAVAAPPKVEDPVVQAARAGASYAELTKLEKNEMEQNQQAGRAYPGYFLYRLADEGLVIPEMITQQKKTREYLLTVSTQLARPKVPVKSAKSHPESVEKSDR